MPRPPGSCPDLLSRRIAAGGRARRLAAPSPCHAAAAGPAAAADRPRVGVAAVDGCPADCCPLLQVAPCCFVALLPPFLLLEAGPLLREPHLPISPHLFLTSGVLAFGEWGQRPLAQRWCMWLYQPPNPLRAAPAGRVATAGIGAAAAGAGGPGEHLRECLRALAFPPRPASLLHPPDCLPGRCPVPPHLGAALNLAVFLLIGRTSALTAKVAGLGKDIALIALSLVLFNASISMLTIVGYGIALLGVTWWVVGGEGAGGHERLATQGWSCRWAPGCRGWCGA